jgi:hypothetical protein
MSFSYMIDKERRQVMSNASGVVTMAEALSHQQNLRNDQDFDPSFSQLADLSNVTSFELSHGDIENLSLENIYSPDSRRAFLVSCPY